MKAGNENKVSLHLLVGAVALALGAMACNGAISDEGGNPSGGGPNTGSGNTGGPGSGAGGVMMHPPTAGAGGSGRSG